MSPSWSLVFLVLCLTRSTIGLTRSRAREALAAEVTSGCKAEFGVMSTRFKEVLSVASEGTTGAALSFLVETLLGMGKGLWLVG